MGDSIAVFGEQLHLSGRSPLVGAYLSQSFDSDKFVSASLYAKKDQAVDNFNKQEKLLSYGAKYRNMTRKWKFLLFSEPTHQNLSFMCASCQVLDSRIITCPETGSTAEAEGARYKYKPSFKVAKLSTLTKYLLLL